MEIQAQEIVRRLKTEFAAIYKPFAKFQDTQLWEECVKAVKNQDLMGHIIFNNNVMEIPPVVSFVKATAAIPTGLKDTEKQAIGAFWGFVFRKVFDADVEKMVSAGNVKGIRSAALFKSHNFKVV